jgi:hypothetical protein
MSAPVHLTGALMSAPVYPSGALSERVRYPHRRAQMRVYSVNRRALAHACARLSESPAHVGPPSTQEPPKTHLLPPVPTLPKKLTPTTTQDVQTTNL